jgi:para-nitrobenzyl esterase
MISPLAKNLIKGAIGSSGSLMGTLSPLPLAEAARQGLEFAARVKAASLAELRVLPAEELLAATDLPVPLWFIATIDGYFLPDFPAKIFAAGNQAHVPLLLGWNSEEMSYQRIMKTVEPTPENFEKVLHTLFGERAGEALRLYPASSAEEALQSATDLAGDTFTGYSTWKWAELQSQTGGQPVYRYLYAHPRPPMRPEMGNAVAGLAGGVIKEPDAEMVRPPQPRGAVHSAEIEYAMGNLETNLVYAWTPDDYQISELMQEYYANFVKHGDPNGPGLPDWPPINNVQPVPVMQLDIDAHVAPEAHRERYLFLDKLANR